MKKKVYMLTRKGIKLLAEEIANNLKGTAEIHHKDEDVFLTIEETALLISLSKFTIYGLVHKNKIPFIKKSKRLYFLKSEILRWMREGKRETKSSLEQRADEYLLKNQL